MTSHEISGPGGSITISPAALAQIVLQAAESVDGARVRRPRRGLEIDLGAGRARIDLELAAGYGLVLPAVAADVQERVAGALEGMCGLGVDAVNVSIEELD